MAILFLNCSPLTHKVMQKIETPFKIFKEGFRSPFGMFYIRTKTDEEKDSISFKDWFGDDHL